ncbi:PREDICTED: molybdenum cofactor sulfurase-like [Ipomoea nil]|uniref:molybdenum cofactor sulfurase-like n=1 Tax=Ipomoea nil TaxID=35883 RepID=UPI000901DC0E|nr:PREDICTED: molybdenum cofactor sulfurase-like [Ipomoea nil]
MASDACFNACCCSSLASKHSTLRPPPAACCHEFAAATASSLVPAPNTQFTNHESLPPCAQMFSRFRHVYPHYCKTNSADEIRAREYYNLAGSNRVCLDYIGHGLFSYSQQQGNHHLTEDIASTSACPPPAAAAGGGGGQFFDILYKPVSLNSQLLYGGTESGLEASIRKRIIKYMNISEDDYSVVFTANQSSAFRLLADAYPFQATNTLLTVYDYQNEAVEAMVESSRARGARVLSAEFSWPNLKVNSRKLRKMVVSKGTGSSSKRKRGLFVFPLQSRVTGTRYSYQWMNLAHDNGWHVLLDASALGAKDMETLGLSLFQPHFLICSFFKVFGENPSGFCCLFVKKSSIPELEKSPTSIGIISLVPASPDNKESSSSSSSSSPVSVQENSRFLGTKEEEEEEEKKQLSLWEFLKLEKVIESRRLKNAMAAGAEEITECRGLDHADKLGLVLISNRARYLVNWLVNALLSLRHPRSENGGVSLVQIYGPKVRFDRGPAIAFNVFDWKGQKVPPALAQKLADRQNISVSCAFLNHIGFSDMYDEDKRKAVEIILVGDNKKRGTSSSGISVITVSLGLLTNFEDMYRLWSFVSRFLDADFVEKERWRYMALNQTTLEL